jgi:hypothetical protein
MQFPKPLIKRLLIELTVALLVFIAGFSSSFVESFYVNGLYIYISRTLRSISGLISFPLGDLLYLMLIAYVLFSLFLFFRKAIKKQLNPADRMLVPFRLINFILILYIAFKLLWGLNYSRIPIASQLGIRDKRYNTEQLLALGDFLIDKINAIQKERLRSNAFRDPRYTAAELQKKAVTSYNLLAQKNKFFLYDAPVLKPVLNSWAITKIGLEGYYNPLSGEANVNMMLNSANLPFVTCHEISHQLGVAREDEANLVGYLVSTHSTDLNFQYSGIYCVLKNVLFEIGITSPMDYKLLKEKINASTLADFKKDRDFWRRYNSDMFGYMDVALDQFLKLNSQRKGVGSYQDIVIWLFNYHRNQLKHYNLKTK